MPLCVMNAEDGGTPGRDGAFECAFVNNMPGKAFAASDRQFLRLLGSAAGSTAVRVRRYAFPGLDRMPGYFPMDQLWDTTPDAIIVTGAQPLADRVEDEPCWRHLTELLDWSVAHARTVLLSCLAGHAALFHFDGLARVHLERKLSGVFPQHIAEGHPLTAGLPPITGLPHSRYNDVPAADLAAAGWELLMWSDHAGWSIATAERSGCQVVVVQGHPEYDPDTLLREFRRDLTRFHEEPGVERPDLPVGYLRPRAEAALAGYLASGSGEFPYELFAHRLRHPWRRPAERLFENWISIASRPVLTVGS